MVREIEDHSESMAEQKLGGYSSRYRFTGKELDPLSGLYDFGARYYDPRLSVWFGVDPRAEKNFAYTPYVYTGNNPIKFIDPDGQDWYEDENGNRRYDEKLTKANQAEFLKDKPGSRYLGETYKETTKNGTNNYRKDGSVMFGSQSDAVDYMVKTTKLNKKEQYAFIDGNSMLVAPDKYNSFNNSNPYESGYNIYDGVFCDPITNSNQNFGAVAHTHPVGSYPSGGYPPGDLEAQFTSHPHIPGFVIGAENGKVAGYGGNDRWPAVDHSTQKNITVKGLISGKQKFPKYDKVRGK